MTHLFVVAVAAAGAWCSENQAGTFPSGVCPSIPDPCDLLCWLGVPGTGGNPSLRLQPPFPGPGGNPSPRLQPPFPSPLSPIPRLGQPCTPWLPGSIPTTPLRAASRQLRYHAEGSLTFETSRPTWVSVQDVVLKQNKRPSTQPSQSIPELSHFYSTQTRRCLCSCRYGSCWRVTPWHKTDAESPVWHLSVNFTKAIKKHMSSQKVFTSRHGLVVQISLSVWKTLKHFKHQNVFHDVSLRLVSNSSSEYLQNVARHHHWETLRDKIKQNFSDQCQTKFLLPKSQRWILRPSSEVINWILRTSSSCSSCYSSMKDMENILIFYFILRIQIFTMFSVQSQYSKKTKNISL